MEPQALDHRDSRFAVPGHHHSFVHKHLVALAGHLALPVAGAVGVALVYRHRPSGAVDCRKHCWHSANSRCRLVPFVAAKTHSEEPRHSDVAVAWEAGVLEVSFHQRLAAVADIDAY